MNEYIELGPDDVIREGDEVYIGKMWRKVSRGSIGKMVALYATHDHRRPRSIAIRDAAFKLLRCMYATTVPEKNMYPQVKALRKALGVTVEELRK